MNKNEKMLEKKMKDSKEIVKRALNKYNAKNLAIAYTGGKDSTLLLYIVYKVCKENGFEIPKCFCIDEGDMFEEVIEFIEKVKVSFGVEVEYIRNNDVLKAAKNKIGNIVNIKSLNEKNKKELARLGYEEKEFSFEPESFVGNHLMKTVTLNKYLEENNIDAFFEGIRWDEQESRSNEEYFSPREATEYSPEHMRICPILHFRERDVWEITFREKLPICSLYKEGYRSLGVKSTTEKSDNKPAWEQDLENTNERGGRRQDKEGLMAKLRKLGYM